MDLRKCTKCASLLPITDYYVTKCRGKQWAYGHCKKCHRQVCKAWKSRNWDRDNKYRREWSQEERKNKPDVYLRKDLQRACKKFGITMAQFVEMYHRQSGGCGICGREEVNRAFAGGRIRRLAIDHCHSTGKVRGLLCSACNQAMGMIDAYPEWLERAKRYKESSAVTL